MDRMPWIPDTCRGKRGEPFKGLNNPVNFQEFALAGLAMLVGASLGREAWRGDGTLSAAGCVWPHSAERRGSIRLQ